MKMAHSKKEQSWLFAITKRQKPKKKVIIKRQQIFEEKQSNLGIIKLSLERSFDVVVHFLLIQEIIYWLDT